MKDKIVIRQGDITDMEVDAIVNAANTELILGAGVAGAIREKGGDSVQLECSRIGRIVLGEAVITGAGKLNSKYVIHAAAMHLGGRVSEKSLREATSNCLKRAEENRMKSLAFPAIGTGIGGLSPSSCACIMIDVVHDYLSAADSSIDEVHFVLYDIETFNIFSDYLNRRKDA